jgi:hypothetical protein
VWTDKSAWLKQMSVQAAHILNDDLKEYLLEGQPEQCWSDDLNWLPGVWVIDEMVSWLNNTYTSVKAYHACSPMNVSSYYENGLIGQRETSIISEFKKIFSDIDDEYLGKAIQSLHKSRGSNEAGKIYFGTNIDDFINIDSGSGHYLIYGSEYILALAAKLMHMGCGYEDYRMRLRGVGTPTVFEVNIPLEQVEPVQIKGLAKTMLAVWGNKLLNIDADNKYGMGFVVWTDIKPSCIVSHIHPDKICDPYYGNTIFRPKKVSCEVCSNHTS